MTTAVLCDFGPLEATEYTRNRAVRQMSGQRLNRKRRHQLRPIARLRDGDHTQQRNMNAACEKL